MGAELRPARLACHAVLLLALLCALGCGRPASDGEASAAADPRGAFADLDLLLITIDTLRADRLGSYGHEAARTPTLDRLAARGVRFENVYSAVPLTLPSHAVLFTGRYPYAIEVRNNGTYFLPPSETTLAERLQERGFTTAATVASYVLSSKFGLAQGFETYDDALGDAALMRTFTSEIPADEVYRRFARWFEDAAQGGRRFFSWVHFYDPHQPYAPPADLSDPPVDPYDGEIAHVDRQIGEILQLLEDRGRLDSTVVIVTSDHGEGFGEHLEHGHGLFCYEESLRVPLIVQAPRLEPAVVDERVGLVDVLPTLVDLYALETEETGAPVQGRSFAPLLFGRSLHAEDLPDEARPPAYFESLLGEEEKNWAPLTGILDEPYKYIALPEPELYDLSQDPAESRNLVELERRVVRRLDEQLRQILLQRTGGASTRRQLSDEDRAHLESLGYLSSSGRASRRLDPKEGIRIDLALDEARAHLEAGDLDRAGEQLERIRERHPAVEMPDFFFLRHEIEMAKGRPEEALAALAAGMEAFPDLEPFAFQRAALLIDLGRFEPAEALCQQLLERNPRFSNAWILRGRAATAQGDLEGARRAYREALALEPRNTDLRLALAEVEVRSGDLAAALEIFRALDEEGALDRRPQELYKLAALLAQSGEFQRAEILFRRGLELEPAGLHRLSLALVLERNGKRPEAIAELERVLAEHPAELSPQQLQVARSSLARWRRESR